ncbi:MAG: M4 family metallopeptidase [bacterium]|nr:M4 family metallopeptidase [bacterium]
MLFHHARLFSVLTGTVLVSSAIALAAPGGKQVSASSSERSEMTQASPEVAAHALRAQFEGLHQHVGQDGAAAFFGKRMTEGRTPARAALGWLTEFGPALGVSNPDLQAMRSNRVHGKRFTVFVYQQYMDGLPVEHGVARLLVLNGHPNRVVYAAGHLAHSPESGLRPAAVEATAAVATVQTLVPYSSLTEWSVPEQVAYFNPDVAGATAARAWKFTGRRGDHRWPTAFHTFFVDAVDGRLLHVRDEIYNADVDGHVSGYATPGTQPDTDYNLPVEMSMENVRVRIVDGETTYSDASGDYILSANGGSETVQADLIGEWVRVLNAQGPTESLAETVTPPGTVDFQFNPLPAEYTTAQINGFIRTTEVHDFYKDRQPDFDQLDFPLNCYVNIPDSCNAFYSGNTINFFNSEGGCVNTAYSGVIAHEYGHFIVSELGLRQGAFGEGFGDCVSLLLYDDPVIGRDVYGPGTYFRQIVFADLPYPCVGEIHYCGQVLAGCWWDTKLELQAILGEAQGLHVVRQLFTDWSQITRGGDGSDSAHPLTLVEALIADDDDGDLYTGTPHDCAILAGFAAHDITTLAVIPDCNGNGTPDACENNDDCNSNGVGDVCDVVLGTSLDCTDNLVPDECEADCNQNGIRDDCDLAAATSLDCNANTTPDECDLAGPSGDCNLNSTPDECDIAERRSMNCNGNTIPDDCEIAAGSTADLDTNGIPDECGPAACLSVWDGFQPNPPFSRNKPVHGIDFNGDGSKWDNPEGTAIIDKRGCETGYSSDLAVRVDVDSGLTDPTEGYMTSEYFHTVDGELDCGAAIYTLSFKPKIGFGIDSRWDWQMLFYDAFRDEPVLQLEFISLASLRSDVVQGRIVVRNSAPPPSPRYLDTGVDLLLESCYDIQIVFDNLAGTVQLYINGVPRLDPPIASLKPLTRRLDYFRIHPLDNLAATTSTTSLKLDDFELCRSGIPLMNWEDCNDNCIDDSWDVSQALSGDCNLNTVPDECDVNGSTSRDCNVNRIPDNCDLDAGTSRDCNVNTTPDECETDCNENGIPDQCDLTGGSSPDCNDTDMPDECELGILHDCCAAHSSPGCSDTEVESCVCSAYPPCCTGPWDEICVIIVELLGCDSCEGNDCNENNVPDDCDLIAGTSADCNDNAFPDECEDDCNGNWIPDDCDVSSGTSLDCNWNFVPDECDIGASASADCNSSGVPDECEDDCNRNGLADECDIEEGTSLDCNLDGNPDECETDCDGNGVTDDCDVSEGTSPDCNGNDVPDECEFVSEVVHLIHRGDLVNIVAECGGDCGSVFNNCDRPTGFTWVDSRGGEVVGVQVEFNVGLECHPNGSVHTTSLNGAMGNSFASTPWYCDCACAPGAAVNMEAEAEDYASGGSNTFLIEDVTTNCFGFVEGPEWGEGVYGRVTVTYAAADDCDEDGIPDECALPGNDCNDNSTLDSCEYGEILEPGAPAAQGAIQGLSSAGATAGGLHRTRPPCPRREGDRDGNCVLDDCED